MKPSIIITLSLLSLTGCIFTGSSLTKLWFYTYSTGGATGKDTLLTPVSFLELRPDGSYTKDFGRFEYGTWTRKDQQLLLTDQQHKTSAFRFDGGRGKDMQLTLANDLVGNFESQPLPSDKPAEDPYSVENNRWRIPATHKESDEEIRRRLSYHCRFWETYFGWALHKELDIVDVRSTPTPIKIYGNGFALKSFEDLPPTWKSYFFDEDDCRKANDLLKNIFEQKTIAWAHTDSKYKMFLSAFQQMEQFLR